MRHFIREGAMAKQTLSIELDTALVERVRRYSEARGTDVAGTIGELIERLPEKPAAPSGDVDEEAWVRELPPLTRSLLGAAAGDAGEQEYNEYLWRKYGP
jgi:hypothetical protein